MVTQYLSCWWRIGQTQREVSKSQKSRDGDLHASLSTVCAGCLRFTASTLFLKIQEQKNKWKELRWFEISWGLHGYLFAARSWLPWLTISGSQRVHNGEHFNFWILSNIKLPGVSAYSATFITLPFQRLEPAIAEPSHQMLLKCSRLCSVHTRHISPLTLRHP